MQDSSADTGILQILLDPAILAVFIGAVLTALGALWLWFCKIRNKQIASYQAELLAKGKLGEENRQKYIQVLTNPKEYWSFRASYESWLLRVLNAMHNFYGKPLSMQAFDRSVLLAFLYPVALAVFFWLTLNTNTSGIPGLMPQGLAWSQRLITVIILILFISLWILVLNNTKKIPHEFDDSFSVELVILYIFGFSAFTVILFDSVANMLIDIVADTGIIIIAFIVTIVLLFAKIINAEDDYIVAGTGAFAIAGTGIGVIVSCYVILIAIYFSNNPYDINIHTITEFGSRKSPTGLGVVLFAAILICVSISVGRLMYKAVQYLYNKQRWSRVNVLFYWLILFVYLSLVAFLTKMLPEVVQVYAVGGLIFFGLFPCINGLFDGLSLLITRTLLQKQLNAGFSIWRTIPDFAVSFLTMIALPLVLVGALYLVNTIIDTQALDIQGMLTQLFNTPAAVENWWIYFMVFSTMLPSVLHLVAMALAYVARWRPKKLDAMHIERLQTNFSNLPQAVNISAEETATYLVGTKFKTWTDAVISLCIVIASLAFWSWLLFWEIYPRMYALFF